jgi:hypothetical protein
MSPVRIATGTGMAKGNVERLLGKMVKDGQVEKIGRGKYAHPSRPHPEATP